MLRSPAMVERRAELSYYELPAADPDRLAEFFRAVFGWDAHEVPWDGPRYLRVMAPRDSRPPGAGILEKGRGGERLVDRLTVNVDVTGEPLAATLARVVAHGGTVTLPPTVIGEFGSYARFLDPEGNSFGLWRHAGDEA
ncbi:MAG: VOC family protein [Thermoanaerobaculia bacterium]|nr:MAG: VOC family protein [Thermoanaerobaculia bacterium]